MGDFSGAAAYYDDFRPGLPQAAIEQILSKAQQPIRLLDLGTGTGRVLAQFLSRVEGGYALEPDADMLALAKKRIARWPVHFANTKAEDMQLPPNWRASLVTIIRAFHWMDRPKVLDKLKGVTLPHAVIAICSDRSLWRVEDPWAQAVRTVIQDFLGPKRQTISGIYQESDHPYEEDLAASAFSRIERQETPIERHWTADQIVGYLYSTSYASRTLLGDKVGPFEQAVRNLLQNYSPYDDFTEHNVLEMLLASRSDC